ncbi:MAG: tetratricopeptide repeat protein, partial [Candidatus Poseidoniaceae archaeon]|nr:tetratricopeptide repeat protein [Candidatus Poseidoniaceae archaeon]
MGAEATCPDCSGPLFGIAPNLPPVSEAAANSGTTTIDNVAVPTYTPPATETQVHPSSDEVPEISRNEPQEMTVQDLVQQGEMLGIEGRHDDALKMFNQAISMDPNDHMAWFNRGVMSEATGDVQDAVKAFRIALDNNPSHGAASANLAVLLQRMGHPGDAVIHAQNGLIAFPGHPALLEIVNSAGAVVPVTPIAIDESEVEDEVEVEMQESEPEQTWAEPQGLVKSLESHHAAVETEIIPESTPIQEGVDLDGLADAATAMIRTGDPAGALEMLRAHLPEAAAEHAPCWRVAAGAMARLELADAAINAFEYALDLEPEHASTWYNLGALKRRGEDIAGAL